MAIVLPTPRPFAGLGQGAMNFVQGLRQREQQAKQAQDVQGFMNFLENQKFEQQPGFTGPPSPSPTPQTPFGSNLLAQYSMNKALQQPTAAQRKKTQVINRLNPKTNKPEQVLIDAETGQEINTLGSPVGATREISRINPETGVPEIVLTDNQGNLIKSFGMPVSASRQGFTLGQGQRRYDKSGNLIAEVPPKPDKERTITAQSVIIDPNDRNKAIRVMNTFKDGELVRQVPIGEATLADKIGGVAAEGLPIQKATQTKIEKDLIDINSTLSEIDVIEDQFNDDFFTYRGKGTAFFSGLAEKLEIPIPKAQSDFLEEKTKFFADSKRVFLKFRKFITGVAGGIQEFNEIAKAAINPEKDSPTEFKAKITSMRDNAKRTRNVMLAMSNSGLDPNNESDRQKVFSGLSLSNVPIDMPENATLESIQPKTMTATNPTTGEQIQSLDGGKTWQPMQ